ncbi:MAG: hypothetical protein ACI4K9_04335 [Candidatus Fimenecus sp.]
MQKQFQTQTEDGVVTEEALAAINRYTQKDLTAEEVFVFSAVLCDNEIDRDFERFSIESLHALAPLFEGKTAIQNHSMDAADQSARTFKTEVITDETRKTTLGEAYTYLKAYCYMPRIPKNEALIAEIAAGIKKEVSVGCAVEKRICSVCGADERKTPCAHRRGKSYKGEVCHYILENPTDAYEWSFVAVPAQKNAGVTKKQFADGDALLKAVRNGQADELTFSRAELSMLSEKVEALETAAADGALYRASLLETAVKGFAKILPVLDNRLAEQMCASLDVQALKQLSEALDNAAPAVYMPQLCAQKNSPELPHNGEFKF